MATLAVANPYKRVKVRVKHDLDWSEWQTFLVVDGKRLRDSDGELIFYPAGSDEFAKLDAYGSAPVILEEFVAQHPEFATWCPLKWCALLCLVQQL